MGNCNKFFLAKFDNGKMFESKDRGVEQACISSNLIVKVKSSKGTKG